jgi:hypothetical protein
MTPPAAKARNDEDQHAERFASRLAAADWAPAPVLGCVYIYPSGDVDVADVRSWVRADRADLDVPLHDAVAFWLNEAWPFETVSYAPR